MSARRAAVFAAVAAVLAPTSARAQWHTRLALRPELGAAMVVSDHQRQSMDLGTGLQAGATLSVDLARAVALSVRGAYWWFPSGRGDAEAVTVTFGARASIPLRAAGRPWIEAAVGPAVTGGDVRVALDAAIGWDFDLTPALRLGPTVRYLQLVAAERDAPWDARALALGASLTLQPPARAVVRADRDGDTVPDADDVCADLPQGDRPDPARRGCPLNDRDSDRVFDRDDDCPNVPAGPQPDPAHPGCPLAPPRPATPAARPAVTVPRAPGVTARPAVPPAPPRDDGAWRGALAEPVLFAQDGAVVDGPNAERLGRIADAMNAAPPTTHFVVEGHADPGAERGNAAGLSMSRASVVVELLTLRGVARERMVLRTAGATRPLWSPRSEVGRRGNRRVEVRVVE